MPSAVAGPLLAGRYRLEQLLGRGAYGEVWRATDTHRSYQVAVKLLLHRDLGQAWYEASLLTALRSQHILSVNNADVAVDVPYIDTDLAKCSIDARSSGLGAEPSQAVDWMRRALRGLDLCHSRGLLHRDVKPANLFLDQNDDCRLGDFGVAALMDGSGAAPPHGDPYIRAPEFFQGGMATVSSDVYAAGVTLYGLLAGRMPFDQATFPELEHAVLTATYPKLRDLAPHVSQALARIVSVSMDPNPSLRFPSPREFDSSLGALPGRSRHFTPIQPHAGHVRCWVARGSGVDLDVCVEASAASGMYDISARRSVSRTRMRDCCATVPRHRLAIQLRQVFDRLR